MKKNKKESTNSEKHSERAAHENNYLIYVEPSRINIKNHDPKIDIHVLLKIVQLSQKREKEIISSPEIVNKEYRALKVQRRKTKKGMDVRVGTGRLSFVVGQLTIWLFP